MGTQNKKSKFTKLIKIHMDDTYGHLAVNETDLFPTLESIDSAMNESYDSMEELLDVVELYLEDASVDYSWILPEVEDIDVGMEEKDDRGEE